MRKPLQSLLSLSFSALLCALCVSALSLLPAPASLTPHPRATKSASGFPPPHATTPPPPPNSNSPAPSRQYPQTPAISAPARYQPLFPTPPAPAKSASFPASRSNPQPTPPPQTVTP